MRLKNKIKRYLFKVFKQLGYIINYHFISHFFTLPPKKVLIALTYRCNSRCIMCNIWKKRKKELSFNQWRQVLKDPIFSQIEELSLTGGEAFIHPNFIKLFKLFIKFIPKLKKIDVVSNGFASKKIITECKELISICQKKRIEFSVSISLDGLGEKHDQIRGVEQAFQKTTNTLLTLKKIQKKKSFWLGSSAVIQRANLDQISRLETWFNRHHIFYQLQIVGFHDSYLNNTDLKDKINYSVQQKPILEQIMLKQIQRPRSNHDYSAYYWQDMYHLYFKNQRRHTPCAFLKDHFAFDCYGDVYFCFSDRKIGNCLKKGLSEIYYDKKNQARRKKMCSTVCTHCNSYCHVNDALKKDFFNFFLFKIKRKLHLIKW